MPTQKSVIYEVPQIVKKQKFRKLEKKFKN